MNGKRFHPAGVCQLRGGMFLGLGLVCLAVGCREHVPVAREPAPVPSVTRRIPADIAEGKCVAVRAGHRIEVLIDGEVVPIRLAFVDCPEEGQAFFEEAKAFTEKYCEGQTLFVRVKATLEEGHLARVSRLLTPPDPYAEELSGKLLAAGLGWYVHGVQHGPLRHVQALEREPRRLKVGVWSEEGPRGLRLRGHVAIGAQPFFSYVAH